MYTKKKNKSIILLLVMNFILFGNIINAKTVNATDEDIIVEESEIISKEELIGESSYMIEYEALGGETLVVNKLTATKLDQIEQEALLRKQEEERQAAILAMKTVETSRVVPSSSINVHTDLSVMNTITADEINSIIDYWDSMSYGTSPFKGQGQVFIDAAKSSGLDPVYILSHAGLESGWGTKDMSHNYFGIGAYDNNPSNGHAYGNSSLQEGIVYGAIWIAENYYKNGQTTLYNMRYNDGYHEYCTSDTWMTDISAIMRTSYSLINR